MAALAAIAIRCDLLEKENIVLVTLCSSQGTAGATPGDRTLRAPAGAATSEPADDLAGTDRLAFKVSKLSSLRR